MGKYSFIFHLPEFVANVLGRRYLDTWESLQRTFKTLEKEKVIPVQK
jgi:hypothetical protein